jgi:hypothetical protein
MESAKTLRDLNPKPETRIPNPETRNLQRSYAQKAVWAERLAGTALRASCLPRVESVETSAKRLQR